MAAIRNVSRAVAPCMSSVTKSSARSLIQPSNTGVRSFFSRGPASKSLSGAGRNFSTRSSLAAKRYTEAHEWIELNQDGSEGTIGVSEYAAKALGDVVYVELPAEDLEVNGGDAIGAVESVKSASDIYSPVAGTITGFNSLLEEKPGTINASPEQDGWIAKIKVKDGEAEKISALMDAEAYAKHTEE